MQGFPGNVEASAEYKVTADNKLVMTFAAKTDAPTPLNLCNHTYWNLSGGLATDIKGHELQVMAPFMLPVNDKQIPTGDIVAVAGTPFDFTDVHTVGERLLDVDGGGEPGYDHCYLRSAAESKADEPGEETPIARYCCVASLHLPPVSAAAPCRCCCCCWW